MYTTLENALRTGEVVSVFINSNDPTTCNVGYIIALNKEQVALLSIDDDGSAAGIFVFYISTILRVDADGDYEKRYDKAYKSNGSSYRPFVYETGDMFISISAYAQKYHWPLWIAFPGNDEIGPFGHVLDVNNDVIKLARVDENEKEGGITYVVTRRIDFIACEYK